MAVFSFNTNIAALGVGRELARSTARVATGYERLATGLRITRASDDAAGLAIADKLRVDSRLYTQARRNVNDGLSMLQIMDGTLEQQSNIVTRLIELAEQSANGTLTSSQRSSIEKEYKQLIQEFGRLGDSTTFNGQNLLLAGRGTNSSAIALQTGITGQTTSQINTNGVDSGTLSGWFNPKSRLSAGQALASGASFSAALIDQYFGGELFEFSAVDSRGVTRNLYVGGIVENANNFRFAIFMKSEDLGPQGYYHSGLDASIGAAGSYQEIGSLSPTVNSNGSLSNAYGNFSVDVNSETATLSFALDAQGAKTYISTPPSTYTGESNIFFTGVSTKDYALNSLTIAKNRLAELGQARGQIGAAQSRLEIASNIALTSGLNTSEAESRIRDADVATEVAQLSMNQIRQQSAAQILRQANLQPELLLRLLQG